MNDVLIALYDVTGDASYLATARKFNAYVFTAPLLAGQDTLSQLPFPHANFHLPEVVGNANAYRLTKNASDQAVSRNFFDILYTNHSFATGGSNSGECWQASRDLGAFLSTQTEESCTQYNILKLSKALSEIDMRSSDADFYERALLNGIVGNQKILSPNETQYIYMLPMGGAPTGGAVTKAWGNSNHGFPCCWGTLSESFAKLSDAIFFQAYDRESRTDVLIINQFTSADGTFQVRSRFD